MRITLPLLAVMALPLAACTTSPYGSGYGSNPLGSILGSIGTLGSNYGGSSYGSSFSQAAVNACAGTASRYGSVGVRDVRQISSSSMKVYGTVSTGYGARSWDCTFRSDGRITDFDI
jgi:hypothetical protein